MGISIWQILLIVVILVAFVVVLGVMVALIRRIGRGKTD